MNYFNLREAVNNKNKFYNSQNLIIQLTKDCLKNTYKLKKN